ncbi:hypothetical protein IWX49DRAFT_557501 [Phyllosticta citricarpa]
MNVSATLFVTIRVESRNPSIHSLLAVSSHLFQDTDPATSPLLSQTPNSKNQSNVKQSNPDEAAIVFVARVPLCVFEAAARRANATVSRLQGRRLLRRRRRRTHSTNPNSKTRAMMKASVRSLLAPGPGLHFQQQLTSFCATETTPTTSKRKPNSHAKSPQTNNRHGNAKAKSKLFYALLCLLSFMLYYAVYHLVQSHMQYAFSQRLEKMDPDKEPQIMPLLEARAESRAESHPEPEPEPQKQQLDYSIREFEMPLLVDSGRYILAGTAEALWEEMMGERFVFVEVGEDGYGRDVGI